MSDIEDNEVVIRCEKNISDQFDKLEAIGLDKGILDKWRGREIHPSDVPLIMDELSADYRKKNLGFKVGVGMKEVITLNNRKVEIEIRQDEFGVEWLAIFSGDQSIFYEGENTLGVAGIEASKL